MRWFLIFCATLLIHLLFAAINPNWFYVPRFKPPAVQLTEVDPKVLARIKEQFKNKKSLLLSDQDNATKSESKTNPKARFYSDKTSVVKEETRARKTDPVPAKLGSKTGKEDLQKQEQPKTTKRELKLGDLGVRLNLKNPTPTQAARKGEDYEADQALTDNSAKLGDRNLLNTEESIYYSFYSRVYQAIAPNWKRLIADAPRRGRIPPGVYITAIDLILDHKGEVIDARLIEPSGVPDLDRIAQQSIKMLERFPNPPAELINAKGEVHTLWTFSLHVDRESGMQWAPTEGAMN